VERALDRLEELRDADRKDPASPGERTGGLEGLHLGQEVGHRRPNEEVRAPAAHNHDLLELGLMPKPTSTLARKPSEAAFGDIRDHVRPI
jgi:hypothetical protein